MIHWLWLHLWHSTRKKYIFTNHENKVYTTFLHTKFHDQVCIHYNKFPKIIFLKVVHVSLLNQRHFYFVILSNFFSVFYHSGIKYELPKFFKTLRNAYRWCYVMYVSEIENARCIWVGLKMHFPHQENTGLIENRLHIRGL